MLLVPIVLGLRLHGGRFVSFMHDWIFRIPEIPGGRELLK